jgi:hypothetical protein
MVGANDIAKDGFNVVAAGKIATDRGVMCVYIVGDRCNGVCQFKF